MALVGLRWRRWKELRRSRSESTGKRPRRKDYYFKVNHTARILRPLQAFRAMSAPALEPADLETLERLCEKGEMLLSAERVFYPLQNLIDAKLAEVVGFWMGADKNARNGLSVVKPTAFGR